MAHRRIYAFDYGRGLAIFGMLLAHTFEKGICDLNSKVELDYLKRVPVWLIACLSPFALLFMMGLFFTFITSMACTMSVINIEKHGRGAVMAYLFYRLVFGFVLKAVDSHHQSSAFGMTSRLRRYWSTVSRKMVTVQVP